MREGLEEYKKKEIEKITGYTIEELKNGELLITAQSGLEALELARKIIGKCYSSIEELEKDLKKLESAVDFYVLFD